MQADNFSVHFPGHPDLRNNRFREKHPDRTVKYTFPNTTDRKKDGKKPPFFRVPFTRPAWGATFPLVSIHSP